MPLDEAVDMVTAAGGVTVLAHPGVYRHVSDLELLFRSCAVAGVLGLEVTYPQAPDDPYGPKSAALMDRFAKTAASYGDRKSTRLNSSHQIISYAVFCLKK